MPKPAAAKGPRLDYDHDRHVYRLDGVVVPGTTQILRAAGLIDDKVLQIPQRYRDRGTAVHEWIDAIEKGEVPAEKAPPVVAGEVRAYLRFKRETGIKILGSEVLVPDRLGRFATRIDTWGQMHGAEWIINRKGPGRFPFYPIQSALEALCFRVGCRRAALHLIKDGSYKFEEWTDPRDFRVAEQAIRTYYAQQEKLHAPT